MEARATLALKPGVWFRRGRLLIVSPDSLGTACPLSGRNSTYRLVQILEAGSELNLLWRHCGIHCGSHSESPDAGLGDVVSRRRYRHFWQSRTYCAGVEMDLGPISAVNLVDGFP